MKVISKKNTRLLVKGGTYEVVYLSNSPSSRYSRICLKDINGSYNPSYFSDLNGNDLPKTNKAFKTSSVKFEDIKKGMLVKIQGNFKTLIKDKIYIVSDAFTTVQNSKYLNNYKRRFIKFKGVNRKYTFNYYNFKILPTDEAREININRVVGNNTEVVGKNVSYSDLVTEKDILLSLVQSISDKRRNNLSIEEWTIQKINTNLKISDIEKIKKITIEEMLEILN